jgi:type II secretory pathway pseudopilin PulG
MKRAPLHTESGLTLIELIIAATMMVVVTGAVVALLVSVMQTQPEVTKRADQIGDARNALEKLSVDLRQGSDADLVSAAELNLETICDTPSGTVRCDVDYNCDAEAGGTYRCLRSVNSEPARIIVTGLSSPDVFCVVPSSEGSECGESAEAEPTYVGVKIEFPAGDQDGSTVLEGGAALHNLTAEGS